MSPRRRSAEKSKLRMDIYSNNDKNARPKGVVSDKRREIDRVIKKARREGDTTSQYWTKKLLEVEEKEPDRWRHSGYKELYVDSKKDSSGSPENGSPVAKKRSTMYSPSAPTSPLPAGHNSRRSSTPPSRRQNDRSISSDVRRGSPPPRSRTDKFASSARPQQRASISPIRRAKSPARSPLRRSRSPPPRRNKSTTAAVARRASPLRRTRTPPLSPPSRVRKLSPRRAKSPPPSRSARSPLRRNKSPSSRPSKPDRPRNRSNDKLSPSVRRKKSPKLARYKSVSRSLSVSPVRRRDKVKPRSPLTKVAAAKRKLAHRTKYRRSSSLSSTSPLPPTRRKNPKLAVENDMLSSSDCSDSNCSMCRFEKSAKEKKKTKADRERVTKRTSPPKEPRLKPRAALPRLPPPSSSRYARSRSLSVSAVNANVVVEERRPELKRKKKSKKKEKKTVLKGSNPKAVTTSAPHNKRIKVESPSDESESPSPKRITLSERFGKMAKWNLKKDVESNQRNIRVTAGDSYRVEELDVPLLEPFPEPSPLLLDGSWDDVRVRYTYYKDQGYLEDLSFQDYLKWEEWWYSYQEWLDSERYISQTAQQSLGRLQSAYKKSGRLDSFQSFSHTT